MDEGQGFLFGSGRPDDVESAPVDEAASAIAARLARELRLGTSSWSFPGWGDLVWSEIPGVKLTESRLARRGLVAYAAHPLLRAVGVDRSYYAPLTEKDCRGYAEQVPEDFRFVMKADRALVFPELPVEPGSAPAPNRRMLDAAYAAAEVIGPASAGFGEKLGAVVFQFPPLGPLRIERMGGPRAFTDRLHDFLAALPPGVQYAVEIRDSFLLTPLYASALHSARASHCYTVHPSMPTVAEQAAAVDPALQRVCLVRWMLNRCAGLSHREAEKRYEPFNRIVDEDERSRGDIADLLVRSDSAQRYAIASNNAEGSAPLTIRRLAERLVGMSRA